MADIDKVAAIHRESFPNSRSTQLGSPFLRKMYRWCVDKQPELAFVAVADGQPVGFVTGAIGGYSRRVFRYAFLEILWGFIRRPRLFLRREMFELWHSYIKGLLPGYGSTPQSGSTNIGHVKASLASIAVSNEVRGKSVGKSLMSAFEIAAQQQGAALLGLSVERDNVAARRLYESCGWGLTREDDAHNSAYYIKEI